MRSAEGFSGRGRSEGIRCARPSPRRTRNVVRARCRPQTGGTRLELLSELAPRVARIALLAAELVDLNVDVIVVTGFQTGKKMPAMNVRRSLFVPTRSGPSSIETPG